MENPAAIFGDNEISKQKSKHLAEDSAKAIELEKYSVSEHSPGVVKNEENIARQVHSPIHYDSDTGDIKPAAFDDVLNKGLSVNRVDHTTYQNIHQSGEEKASQDRKAKPDREYIGYIEANKGDIRTILESGKRVFAVYDSGNEQSPHHADVCGLILGPLVTVNTTLPKKAANKKRRLILKGAFGHGEFVLPMI